MKIEQALQRFIEDKEDCIIYLDGGITIIARIIEIGDGFIIIDEKDSESVVNIEHIMRVRSILKMKRVRKK